MLLLLEYDYPHPLNEAPSDAQSDARLTWLRQRCGAPSFPAEMLHLGPLTRYEIAEILLPASQQYAADLFLMSDGLPKILQELLAWWRAQGVAEEELTGYWTIKHLPAHTYRFTELDLAHTVDQALTHSAALAAVYAPHHERILETLATIYQSLGLTHLAAAYRQRWHMLLYLDQEAALTERLPLAKGEGEQRSLVRRILRFFSAAYHRRHPGQLLRWLQAALSFSQRLRDQWRKATTLNNIGGVYDDLGEKQKALRYYTQALSLIRQVSDHWHEPITLGWIAHT